LSDKEKRVLILAISYPPYNESGSARPAGVAKWLPQYGWKPMVVCPQWERENCRERFDPTFMPEALAPVIERVQLDIRGGKKTVLDIWHSIQRFRSLNCIQRRELAIELLNIPRTVSDIFLKRWFQEYEPYQYAKQLVVTLTRIVPVHKPNVIWATYPEAATLTAASWISRKFSIPWVADFRDIIEQHMFWKGKPWYLRHWARWRQTRVTKSASAIITVSPALAKTLEIRFCRPIHVIPNGFDPEQYPVHRPAIDPLFSITFTGTIPWPLQDPRPLFRAIDRLAQSGFLNLEDILIKFYRPDPSLIHYLSSGYHCADRVKVFPQVPRAEALAAQRKSQILLHLANANEKGIYTSKIFEYLGARRPILSIPGDKDCVDALLAETGAGVSCPTVDSVCEAIISWYQMWREKGEVPYNGRQDLIAQYSREKQASKLAEILDNIVDHS
jgi:glycosyltransferase involved in cell wall biosynthesis